LPPIPPPQSSGTEKKESQDRRHNQACRPSGKRSSTSSHDLHPDAVLTVTCSFQISPSLKCQSSASAFEQLGPSSPGGSGRVVNIVAQDSKRRVALITGVTGQDGAYLAEHLLGLRYMVHGIKRR